MFLMMRFEYGVVCKGFILEEVSMSMSDLFEFIFGE